VLQRRVAAVRRLTKVELFPLLSSASLCGQVVNNQ